MKQKIKIDKPIIFLDTEYDQIMFFQKITKTEIYGWYYDMESHVIINGHWNRNEWEKNIKSEKMGRFKKLGDKILPSEYSRNLIIELFE